MYSEEEVLAMVRRAYDAGEATFSIERRQCALLVIDMQDEFVRPGWTPYWVPDATRLVPLVKRLVEYCREVGVPVIFTAFAATHRYLDRPYSGRFMPNRFPGIEEDPEWFRDGRIWHELAPREDEVVLFKPSYGAFYDTPLASILRNMHGDTIIIFGTLTNYCCGTTARQGYERGFKVVFGSDVTGTDDPELQESELKVLRKGFARVLTANEIIEALSR